MKDTTDSKSKPNILGKAETAFAQIVAEATRRGFYGTAGVVLSVQDGSVQHVRVAVERMIK